MSMARLTWGADRQPGCGQRCQPPGSQEIGPNPTGRSKLAMKRHLAIDARGAPPAITLTRASRHNSMAFERTVDAIPVMPAGT
jgi:hypothetical protein